MDGDGSDYGSARETVGEVKNQSFANVQNFIGTFMNSLKTAKK